VFCWGGGGKVLLTKLNTSFSSEDCKQKEVETVQLINKKLNVIIK
jgi:hypothetical protein